MNSKEQIEKDEKAVARYMYAKGAMSIACIITGMCMVIISLFAMISGMYFLVKMNLVLALFLVVEILIQGQMERKIMKIMKPYMEKYKDQLPPELRI
ncbi:MAG: hypothetical protein WC788_05525 [Candidatus Paceibacterota bacterium]|jgi:hypothetical protein